MMRRFVLVPLWTCVLGLTLAAARDAAAQAGGSITGQVLVRERANGEQSLLVTVQNKDAPLDGVTVALPANLRVNLGSAPPGWTFKQDGRELQASGPPYSRVNLRFDTARNSDMLKRLMRQGGETVQLEIRVPGVRGVQRVGFKVAQLPKVEVLTSLDGALTVPPQVTPGQPFVATPAPKFKTGMWRMIDRLAKQAIDATFQNLDAATADSRAQAIAAIKDRAAPHIDPDKWQDYMPTEQEIQEEVQYLIGRASEGPATFSYVDHWNEELVNAPAGWSTAPPAECPLAITGGTPQTFAGQDACVSGCFSELEKAAALLMLDGERPLELRAASPTTMVLRIPADVMPGPHSIDWRMPEGPLTGRLQLGVLQLQGTIDQNQLWTGQSTTMRLLVLGTDKPTALNIVNRTPGIIAVEGGVRQLVTTPGGDANAVTRSVRGIMKGNFDIGYSLDQPVCGAGVK